MVLYVDETENEKLFIVTGVLADSEMLINDAYRRFKKAIRGFRIPAKYKSVLYTEFKSTLLDRNYTKIKIKLLEEIVNSGCSIIYSVYFKKTTDFNQSTKENVYIDLLSSVVSVLGSDTEIVFDGFNKKSFEDKIIDSLEDYVFVKAIRPGNSQELAGLQFADNVCSVVRHLQMNDDKKLFYQYIKQITKRV